MRYINNGIADVKLVDRRPTAQLDSSPFFNGERPKQRCDVTSFQMIHKAVIDIYFRMPR